MKMEMRFVEISIAVVREKLVGSWWGPRVVDRDLPAVAREVDIVVGFRHGGGEVSGGAAVCLRAFESSRLALGAALRTWSRKQRIASRLLRSRSSLLEMSRMRSGSAWSRAVLHSERLTWSDER